MAMIQVKWNLMESTLVVFTLEIIEYYAHLKSSSKYVIKSEWNPWAHKTLKPF